MIALMIDDTGLLIVGDYARLMGALLCLFCELIPGSLNSFNAIRKNSILNSHHLTANLISKWGGQPACSSTTE
jgi:hypothetical protein